MLAIEPRVLAGESLTRWDVRRGPDNVATEAKAQAGKPDLVELLNRCRTSVESGSKQLFEMVYGSCTTTFIRAIEKLVRLAKECAGDQHRFGKLCDLEGDDAFQEVRDVLGPVALTVGQSLTLKPTPEHVLHDAIDLHLQFLFPPMQRKHVKEALCVKFVSAMKGRETHVVRMIVKELRESGIEFVDPGSILPTHIDPSLHKAMFLLQRCDVGVPIEVLADLAGCALTSLTTKFEQTQAAGISQTGICTPNPLPARLDHPNSAEVLANGLSGIIEYIKANRSNESGLAQVANALALVRECHCVNPAAATSGFDPLDKLLKRSGQKRRVLEMATITIDAARAVSPPTETFRKAEAKALICGLAWVYQRTGRFDEAEAAARSSLKIGEDLGWKRNTAFCLKCMGRLCRVRAEQEQNHSRITKLLSESRDLLVQAIDAFHSCAELTPVQRQEEVGDCYSLLGRTHLLGRRTSEADQCATQAREFITSSPAFEMSKDYMDLLILEGELLASQLDYATADAKFAEAMQRLDPSDAEKSEIAARAHLARGLNLFRWRQDRVAAVEELKKAAQIWEQLDEHYYRGLAEWWVIEIMDQVTKRERARLKKATPPVRVEMVRLIREQRQVHSSRTLSQRAELNDAAWQQIYSEATRNDAIRYKRW